MGASLVVQVLANWSHLSDRAFRVLVRMAVTALDNPQNGQPAGIYHGGREALAMSLRSKGGTARTRYRSVAEAVAELTEAGVIEHLAVGWAGQNAVYRLTLSNTKPDVMGGPRAHPKDGSTAHPMDVPTARKRVGPGHTPRNQEDLKEERAEEEVGLSTTTSHPSRATGSQQTAPVIALFPGTANAPAEPPYRQPIGSRRWTSRGTDEIDGASARVAQRKAEHQARLASGETT